MNKSKVAYHRKLLIAALIDSERHNLVSLEQATGMTRPTLQTAMKGLPDIGIIHSFVQAGNRHRQGYYAIDHWGFHDREAVLNNLQYVIDVIQGKA